MLTFSFQNLNINIAKIVSGNLSRYRYQYLISLFLKVYTPSSTMSSSVAPPNPGVLTFLLASHRVWLKLKFLLLGVTSAHANIVLLSGWSDSKVSAALLLHIDLHMSTFWLIIVNCFFCL